MNNLPVQQGDNEMAAVGSSQYLTFTLEDELYGVDILSVREIRGWENVRHIPNTPAYIKGVLNMRGTIVPIIDMRERFGLTVKEYTPTTVIIVLSIELHGQEHMMGIVVDGVSDVIDVKTEEVKSAPNFGSKINTRFISSMVLINEQMCIMLDSNKLLDPEELAELAKLDTAD